MASSHIKEIAARITALAEDFKAKMLKAGVPANVVESVLVVCATSFNDPSARAYAGAMEDALDDYGVPGLATQVAYFLINAGKWQGDEARAHKVVLKKWSSKAMASVQTLKEQAWTDNVETTWSPPEGFFKQTPDKIAHGLKATHKDLKSAMGSLNFYINRAGKNLDPAAKQRLHLTKDKLESLYTTKAAFNPEYILRKNPELVNRVREAMKGQSTPSIVSDTLIAIALQDLIVQHGTLALSSMPDAVFKSTIHAYLDDLHKVNRPGAFKSNPHPVERRKA